MPKKRAVQNTIGAKETAGHKGRRPCILVTNDDGIHSPGLHALAEQLRAIADVYIIAPDREQSAVSHSFTMTRPLRATRVDERTTIIDGTPADCVMFGTKGFLERVPDLLVAGVNRGPNLGHDTIYSGTVAAAHEGHLSGLASVAISVNYPNQDYRGQDFDFAAAARFGRLLAGEILERGMPSGVFLNVNVPHIPWEEMQGVAITRLGERQYHDRLIKRVDPFGRDYYWIGGDPPTWVKAEGTDFHALEENKISITPLGQDMTQFHAIPELDRWELSLT
ncbi:MAG: 5'/3'-nucleotidase SurE [bacterium]